MVPPHGLKFAVNIITAHFGDLVAKVCECLLRRGPLTLQLIARFTELSAPKAKNGLLVLIQHNCVQAFLQEQAGDLGDGSKPTTQYIALFDNIIHRLRFPKFLAIVKQELDTPPNLQCTELVQVLLEHGRLTLNQMVQNAKSREGSDAARENLCKLVSARFVESCPAPEPVIRLPAEDEAPKKKRGAKSAKIIEVVQTLEERVIEAATPAEGQRFLLVTHAEPDEAEAKVNNSADAMVGDKRPRDVFEDDIKEESLVWRLNFEQFICRLRHKACIEKAREHFDDGAGNVITAMIDATKISEKKVKTPYSASLSLDSIYEEVIKTERGRNMTFDRVRASLVQLGYPPFVKVVDESYTIDFQNIIILAKNEEAESVVLKRYGQDAYKMFRLLLKGGCFYETDKIPSQTLSKFNETVLLKKDMSDDRGRKIASATFTEKKEALKILLKLWKDEYLHMERLQLSQSKTEFMLWKANKEKLWEHVLDEMYHAALNLRIREADERLQEEQMSSLPADKFGKRLKTKVVLHSALMKLDDAILLFHHF